jgi:L-arabinose transport system substrate-binding protein
MKRFVSWIMAVMAVCLLMTCISCQSNKGKTVQKIKIGYLVKQPEELWFINEWKFAQQAADTLGFDLVKIGTPDGEKLLSAIDVLAAQGLKGFVVCTPDVRLGPAIVAKAGSVGMKVFSVDDQFVGPDGKFMEVPYMGLSARQIGRQVGAAVYDEAKKRGWKVDEMGACVVTYDQLNTVKERSDGSTEAILEAGFPKDRIFTSAEKQLDVPSAIDAASVILTQHPKIKKWLVYSVNDESVIGTIRAMEGRNFGAESVIGIGIGAGQGFNELKKEKPTGYFACCLISPKRHGYETVSMMYKWVKDGIAPPVDTRTEGVLATRDNYKQVATDLGLLDLLK